MIPSEDFTPIVGGIYRLRSEGDRFDNVKVQIIARNPSNAAFFEVEFLDSFAVVDGDCLNWRR